MKLLHTKGTNFFTFKLYGTFDQKLNSLSKWDRVKNIYDDSKKKIKNFIKGKKIIDVVIIQEWNRKGSTAYTSTYFNDLIIDENYEDLTDQKITQSNLIILAIKNTLNRSYDYELHYDISKPHPLRAITFKFIYKK